MDRRAAQQNSGSAPPPQSSAAPPPPPASSTVAPPPPASTSVVRPTTGSSSAAPPTISNAPTSSASSSVALPISSSSSGSQQTSISPGWTVSGTQGSSFSRGTVPRGPTDTPSSSGTATINSTEDNAWTDTVVAITWGSIGGVILLVIGILIWRNKRHHDKQDATEPESYHPPVLRHPPRPAVPSGQYALSAAQLEQIQAQEDMRREQEEAMGFQVPYGQPGSRFSLVSQHGSALAAPPALIVVPNSGPPTSNSIATTSVTDGGAARPMLHRMASAPVFVRPISFVGPSTPANSTPNSNVAPLSPVSGASADSSPYPQTGPYSAPVYMIPVSSAAQINPNMGYATMGVQYAQTLPMTGLHHGNELNGQPGGQAGLGITTNHPDEQEPSASENDKAQATLIPEGDNVERRPSAENVRHRQTGGSPQSATVGVVGNIPHSSSTYSLTED